MAVQITDSSPAVSEDVLDALQLRLGILLPANYRHFLLRHNGGRPEPNIYETKKGSSLVVHVLYSIGVGGVNDLEGNLLYEPQREILSSHTMLPVASDPGGNRFCLSLKKREYGAVYFWDHERESRAFILIAKDFEELIDSLQGFSAEDEAITDVIQTQDTVLLQKLIDDGLDVNSERHRLMQVSTANNQPSLVRVLLKNGAKIGRGREIVARAEKFLDRDYTEIKALFDEYGDQ